MNVRGFPAEAYVDISKKLDNIRVVVGDYFQDPYTTTKTKSARASKDLFDKVEETQELKVEKLIMHNEYLLGSTDTKRNHDIVLIKITEESYKKIQNLDRKFVRAACLPSRMVRSTL